MHTALWTLAAVSVVGAFVAAARPRTHAAEAEKDGLNRSLCRTFRIFFAGPPRNERGRGNTQPDGYAENERE